MLVIAFWWELPQSRLVPFPDSFAKQPIVKTSERSMNWLEILHLVVKQVVVISFLVANVP